VAKIPVGFDNSIVGTDNIDQLINAPNDDKPTNSSDDNTEPKVDFQINLIDKLIMYLLKLDPNL
jgi:hypothetical protein